jgi:hypothetical protein
LGEKKLELVDVSLRLLDRRLRSTRPKGCLASYSRLALTGVVAFAKYLGEHYFHMRYCTN